jgi:hypothetical protein
MGGNSTISSVALACALAIIYSIVRITFVKRGRFTIPMALVLMAAAAVALAALRSLALT